MRAWWQQLLAALAPRLGFSPDALEVSVLSRRFTIAAICALPLVLVEGGGARLLSWLLGLCWLLLSLVLGPLPTLCRFVALPLTQTGAFLRTELLPFLFGTVPPEAGKEGEKGVASGEGEEGQEGQEGDDAAGGEEERRSKSRLEASATVQFELLLAATKSLVPLLALVCTVTHLLG
jgi:hypothetical protein